MIKTKKPRCLIGGQYLILLTFWIIFTGIIITFLVLFLQERQDVNNKNNIAGTLSDIANGKILPGDVQTAYEGLMGIKYPLIDFSLLAFNFFGSSTDVTDWAVAWNQRATNINIAYSYLFITAVIALIALCYYIAIIIKLAKRRAFEWRYNLSTQFPNDYVIFGTRMYLNFITNLTIIFSFFNFLTTLITLAYGALLVIVSYFFWYVLGKKTEVLVPHHWWKASNFSFFVTILLIQNGYTLIKSVFASKFGVDLDLILSIIIPIGTITVIIAVFIKNMLSAKVTSIRSAINSIGGKVGAFRIFYYTQREKSLEDYMFVSQLPTLIKGPLSSNAITIKEAVGLMTTIDETALFLENHFVKKPKEKNYMLYHLFNEVASIAEIEEIKGNILRVEAKKGNKTVNVSS